MYKKAAVSAATSPPGLIIIGVLVAGGIIYWQLKKPKTDVLWIKKTPVYNLSIFSSPSTAYWIQGFPVVVSVGAKPLRSVHDVTITGYPTTPVSPGSSITFNVNYSYTGTVPFSTTLRAALGDKNGFFTELDAVSIPISIQFEGAQYISVTLPISPSRISRKYDLYAKVNEVLSPYYLDVIQVGTVSSYGFSIIPDLSSISGAYYWYVEFAGLHSSENAGEQIALYIGQAWRHWSAIPSEGLTGPMHLVVYDESFVTVYDKVFYGDVFGSPIWVLNGQAWKMRADSVWFDHYIPAGQ